MLVSNCVDRLGAGRLSLITVSKGEVFSPSLSLSLIALKRARGRERLLSCCYSSLGRRRQQQQQQVAFAHSSHAVSYENVCSNSDGVCHGAHTQSVSQSPPVFPAANLRERERKKDRKRTSSKQPPARRTKQQQQQLAPATYVRVYVPTYDLISTGRNRPWH